MENDTQPFPNSPEDIVRIFHAYWREHERTKDKTPWDDLTPEQLAEIKAQIEARPSWQWVAELVGSEMYWAQQDYVTPFGYVFAFRFGYDIPKTEEDKLPHWYIIFPEGNFENNAGAWVLRTYWIDPDNKEWRISSLEALSKKYDRVHLGEYVT